jgi:hypothetical protein
MMKTYQRPSYNRTLREAGKQEQQKIVGGDWLSKKRGEAGMN